MLGNLKSTRCGDCLASTSDGILRLEMFNRSTVHSTFISVMSCFAALLFKLTYVLKGTTMTSHKIHRKRRIANQQCSLYKAFNVSVKLPRKEEPRQNKANQNHKSQSKRFHTIKPVWNPLYLRNEHIFSVVFTANQIQKKVIEKFWHEKQATLFIIIQNGSIWNFQLHWL